MWHQFGDSCFDGRLQVGYRSRRVASFQPLVTVPYSCLVERVSTLVFHGSVDYYVTVNTVSGVRRLSSDLFSLHNLVIDLDCHDDLLVQDRDILLDALVWRLKHSVFGVFLPLPSSLVYTGRGLQLWWGIEGISGKFKGFYEEVLGYYCEVLSAFLVDGLDEDFSFVTVDQGASHNLLGFFRLPCTVNTKTNTFVRYEILGPIYTLMDLFHDMKGTLERENLVFEKKQTTGMEKRVSGDYVSLAQARLEAYYALRELRQNKCGAEERNNFCFMVYNNLVPCYGHDVAFSQMQRFNEGFHLPLLDHELDDVISTAKKKGGYQYTNAKLMEFLHISEEEARLTGLSKQDSAYIPKRTQAKLQTATKKQQRNQDILTLYDQNVPVSHIAKKLSLSEPTITSVLKSHGKDRTTLRKNRVNTLYEQGRSVAEIAKLCECSTRTIQRILA